MDTRETDEGTRLSDSPLGPLNRLLVERGRAEVPKHMSGLADTVGLKPRSRVG